VRSAESAAVCLPRVPRLMHDDNHLRGAARESIESLIGFYFVLICNHENDN
jgi:hypothetical protein